MNNQDQPQNQGDEARGDHDEQDEDDAPEVVQGGPWSAFPDLIRVESGKGESNASIGDDEVPEGQGSRNPLPGPSGSSRLGRPPAVRINAANPVVVRDLGGAIPKRSSREPVAAQPDLTSRRSTAQSSSAWVSRPASSGSSSQHSSASPVYPMTGPSSSNATANNGMSNTSSGTSQQFEQIQSQLANISAVVTSLNQCLENLSGDMNRRLNQLDSRINSICAAVTESRVVSNTTGSQAAASSPSGIPNSSTSSQDDVIRFLIAQQRNDLATERSSLLMSLSDALRATATASESVNKLHNCVRSCDENHKNGPSDSS